MRVREEPRILVMALVVALAVSGCRGATVAPPDTRGQWRQRSPDLLSAAGGTGADVRPDHTHVEREPDCGGHVIP